MLPVHPLCRTAFLRAGILLWGVVNEVEPGFVFGAQSVNVRSMASGPNVFLDVARIGEPLDGEFASWYRTLCGPGYMILVSPGCGRRLGLASWF